MADQDVTRPATSEDIPRVLEMGRKFHTAAGVYAPYSEAATARTLQSLIDSPEGVLLVSNGGMIGGAAIQAYCADNWKIAVEMFWWCEDRQGLKLLRDFENWAAEIGANEVRMTTIHTLEGASRILGRKGYAPCEISHGKVI